MNTFELDEAALKMGWGDDGQYWFSLSDYTIKNHYEYAEHDRPEDMEENEFMLTHNCIPYFRVSRIELAKAYIDAIASDKLKAKLAVIEDDREYIEAFWKYFNAYPHFSEGYEEFQNNYLIKKAINWCDENKINYIVK